MPLPFLTADRAFDAAAPRTSRCRSTTTTAGDVRTAPAPGASRLRPSLLLLASFVLLAAMIIAFAGALPGTAVCLVLALGVILCALRLLRIGAWVSRHGVRRVGFFTTATVPWNRVIAIRTVQQPVRWLGFPRTVQGQALIARTPGGRGDGRRCSPTHNADFLTRGEAFDRAADTVEAWGDEYRRA